MKCLLALLLALTGYHELSLKKCLPELIQPLKIIFRKSLDSGDIPAILKRAAIILVFRDPKSIKMDLQNL